MKLSPQQKLIVDYLSDGDWHCMASADFYMKDDRTRISELQKKGFVIEGEPCRKIDSNYTKEHSSNVYMRRLRIKPTKTIFKVEEINGKYYKRPIEVALF